tara:strand:+ start:1748 stop:2131 length:384 start_codon:yes stop_codon:yes gene_type:complete
MSLYVRIENGEVKDCWSIPPDNRPGWKSAIEIRPTINHHRQYYTGHTFDLTKDPVEIVYGVVDISVNDRKNKMKEEAQGKFNILLIKQAQDPSTYDPVALQAAKDAVAPKHAAIDACTTHDELDALL